MKTKKIISYFRIAMERISLLIIALVIGIYALQQYVICDLIQHYWLVGALPVVFYVILTFSEDYLNNRILKCQR
ncbi:MAG: hypothetical protein IJ218_02350 [Alphaproteobacteria bacterium]|nr:hypothetical protein [Alphaproteobacteria bacterium]